MVRREDERKVGGGEVEGVDGDCVCLNNNEVAGDRRVQRRADARAADKATRGWFTGLVKGEESWAGPCRRAAAAAVLLVRASRWRWRKGGTGRRGRFKPGQRAGVRCRRAWRWERGCIWGWNGMGWDGWMG
jgi:hypothetical protein